MHELQQILLQKLPRLGELTFWCEVMTPDGRIVQVLCTDPEVKVLYNKNTEYLDYQYEILGHPFSHSDLLEALGEDWAMDWAYYLFNHVLKWRPDFPEPILLPRVLSDLSLPEYEETRKQLISLLK